MSARGGGVVVAVDAAGGADAFARCLKSVLAHTGEDVPILVPAALHGRSGARQPRVRGVDGPSAVAATAGYREDVAVLDGTALVGPGWLDGLRAGLDADGTVATVSPITLSGGETGLRRPRTAHPADRLPDEVMDAVRRSGLDLHPRLQRTLPACRLVARRAVDVAGPVDDAFDARCAAHGLLHVAAGRVLVYPVVDGEPFEPLGELLPEPLTPVLLAALEAVDGRSVTIDGRILTAVITGTQVHTLELIAALHRTGDVSIRVVVPHDLGRHAQATLDALPGVELLRADEVDSAPRTLLVHRPYQVSSAEDLVIVRRLGHRLVVTHQDLMSYDVAAYHRDDETWGHYRRLTREALGAADAVVTLSDHVARDLRAENLVAHDRVHVVGPGLDHRVHDVAADDRRPNGLDGLGDRPFLLCLGTDLRHKHRPFALELLRALRTEHGWDGALVLAGPQVAYGSSQGEEARLLLEHPDVAGAVVVLPSVDEAEKRWLYRAAAAVVCPTLREGFGFVPGEAASVGTPCLFAALSAFLEFLPPEAARLVPWDARASAANAIDVLLDEAAARALVGAVRTATADLLWDRTAVGLNRVYRLALTAEPRAVAALAVAGLESEAAREQALEREYAIGPEARLLMGPNGLLPHDAQQTLAGLARRGPTRWLLLRVLRLLRHVKFGPPRLTRRRRGSPSDRC